MQVHEQNLVERKKGWQMVEVISAGSRMRFIASPMRRDHRGRNHTSLLGTVQQSTEERSSEHAP
jgi:uncharacterized protein YoaH (UPF0181 family)